MIGVVYLRPRFSSKQIKIKFIFDKAFIKKITQFLVGALFRNEYVDISIHKKQRNQNLVKVS